MAVYKDKKRGTWYTSFPYVDWTGKRCRKLKRGFLTKKEAQNWENHFKLQKANSLDMTFDDFFGIYEADVKPKIRYNTWCTKEHIIKTKILPYFKDLCQDISESDILSILRYMNRTSLDQLMEESMLEIDALQGDEGIQLEVFEELDADITSALNHFFDSLTDMEKLFVLLHVRCCDETYGKMTAEELSVSSLVVSIAAASEKLRKSILTGDLTIRRPKRSSAQGNTSIKLKNVEIVSYNVIRYHRKKAADYLKLLEEKLPIEDFSGRHAVEFFETQWNELVEKYSF